MRTFTLVELLVILAVLCILCMLLVPLLQESLTKAKTAACANQLHQSGTGLMIWVDDHNGFFPPQFGCTVSNANNYCFSLLQGALPRPPQAIWYLVDERYVDEALFACPARNIQYNGDYNAHKHMSYVMSWYTPVRFEKTVALSAGGQLRYPEIWDLAGKPPALRYRVFADQWASWDTKVVGGGFMMADAMYGWCSAYGSGTWGNELNQPPHRASCNALLVGGAVRTNPSGFLTATRNEAAYTKPAQDFYKIMQRWALGK